MKYNYDEDEQSQADREADQLNAVRSVKTIKLSAHCQDRSEVIGKDANGREVVRTEPYYMRSQFGLGSGDYVELEVDIETGQILNWKKPSDEDLIDGFYGDNR